MFLKPVSSFIKLYMFSFPKETLDFSARINGDLSEPYNQLNS